MNIPTRSKSVNLSAEYTLEKWQKIGDSVGFFMQIDFSTDCKMLYPSESIKGSYNADNNIDTKSNNSCFNEDDILNTKPEKTNTVIRTCPKPRFIYTSYPLEGQTPRSVFICTPHIMFSIDGTTSLMEKIKPFLLKNSTQKVTVTRVTSVLLDMYELGSIYKNLNEDNSYAKSSAIFQFCDKFFMKHKHYFDKNNSSFKAKKYIEKAYENEVYFLKSIGKGNENNINKEGVLDFVKKVENKIEIYKQKLIDIRDIHEQTKNLTQGFVNYDIQNVRGRSDKDKLGLIQLMMRDCFNQLGRLPEGCEYAVMGLGSLASGMMTPWSDFEFCILINKDKEEYKKYFCNFTKLLNIKIVNLGETPLRVLGIKELNDFTVADHKSKNADWCWDSLTKPVFSIDGSQWHACKSPLGRKGYFNKKDYELIRTPERMKDFFLDSENCQKLNKNYWFGSDGFLVQSLKSVSLIAGDTSLFEEHLCNIKAIDQGLTRNQALSVMNHDLDKFGLKLGQKNDGSFNIKQDIYRVIERIVNNLAHYFSITCDEGKKSMPLWDVVESMESKGILSQRLANVMIEAINIADKIRTTNYHKLYKQEENMVIKKESAEYDSLSIFFSSMIRIHKSLTETANTNPEEIIESLNEMKLDQLSDYECGLVHIRLGDREEALKYFKTLLDQNTVLSHLLSA